MMHCLQRLVSGCTTLPEAGSSEDAIGAASSVVEAAVTTLLEAGSSDNAIGAASSVVEAAVTL